MKSKASLVLLEQVVMILVFALAAALCLQAFTLSDRISAAGEAQDRAVQCAQNAAEVLKDCGGDTAQAVDVLGGIWDGEALVCAADEYTLHVTPVESEAALLGTAEIAVFDADGTELTRLSVAWQEVDGGE